MRDITEVLSDILAEIELEVRAKYNSLELDSINFYDRKQKTGEADGLSEAHDIVKRAKERLLNDERDEK